LQAVAVDPGECPKRDAKGGLPAASAVVLYELGGGVAEVAGAGVGEEARLLDGSDDVEVALGLLRACLGLSVGPRLRG
jgi:hypothetical protein